MSRHESDEHLGERKPRLARMYVSEQDLREVLPIPESATILGSRGHEGEIEIVLSAPEFPELDAGDELPIVTPVFRDHRGRGGRVVRQFVDWGL